MTPADLIAKAIQAITSAKVLLKTGDADGASNRAYYAMFDAARAALIAAGVEIGKTHRGVLNAFSARFIKDGPLPKNIGRFLKRAETFRYVADYEGSPVSLSDASELVAQAEQIVAAVRATCVPESPDDERKGQGR